MASNSTSSPSEDNTSGTDLSIIPTECCVTQNR